MGKYVTWLGFWKKKCRIILCWHQIQGKLLKVHSYMWKSGLALTRSAQYRVILAKNGVSLLNSLLLLFKSLAICLASLALYALTLSRSFTSLSHFPTFSLSLLDVFYCQSWSNWSWLLWTRSTRDKDAKD